jgi:putative membrane protein
MEIKAKDSTYIPIIISLSIAIPFVVALLMLIPDKLNFGESVKNLPLFHAVLNGATAVALLTGVYFIKNRQINYHRICMLTAFCLSSVFLISYVTYHVSTPATHFGGSGLIKYIYFFILITHIVLATGIIPLALFSIYRGLSSEFEKHRKISKITFPIWLYVAITGVLVYWFMQPYY